MPKLSRPTMLGATDCEAEMYVRVSIMEASPDSVDESIRQFKEETIPQVRQISGFEGANMFVSRDTGKLRVETFWSSRQELEASSETANRLREEFADRSQGARIVGVEVYEVAAQEGRARLAAAA